MTTKYVFAVLSAIFFLAGAARLAQEGGRTGPASKAWLMTGVIFTVVSLLLWFGL